jgi:hypothetical protein
MHRIEQITGKVLSEPDVAFNPQLATRAWDTLRALQRYVEGEGTASSSAIYYADRGRHRAEGP